MLRRAIRRKRLALSRRQRLKAEHNVAVLAARFIKRGKRIGGYVASGSELNIEQLLGCALERNAQVFLPIIPDRGRRLWFSRLGTAARWYRHPHYPIMEYAGSVLRAELLDVLFVPLVAVDAAGYRLGQGGGYYDTTLQAARSRRPLLVGVAFDCQRVEQLPRESWDLHLDWLVTESGLYRFSAR